MTAELFSFPTPAPVPPKEKPKPIKQGYTGEFLIFWDQLYPPRFNSSKHLAFKAWNKLDDNERKQAMIAAPIYARSMIGKDQQFTMHAATWLNGKYFETIAVPQTRAESPAALVNWAAAVQIFEATGRWSNDLGPEPGKPGCRMPAK